jgi:hypothetical protein
MASVPVSKYHTPDELTKEQTLVSSDPESPIHEEYQYLNLIRDILEHGEHRPDRYHELDSNPLRFTEYTLEPGPVHCLSSLLQLFALPFRGQIQE